MVVGGQNTQNFAGNLRGFHLIGWIFQNLVVAGSSDSHTGSWESAVSPKLPPIEGPLRFP